MKRIKNKIRKADLIISTPTFWSGMRSIFNLYNAFPVEIDQKKLSNYYQLKRDFQDVGLDIKEAMIEFEEENDLDEAYKSVS